MSCELFDTHCHLNICASKKPEEALNTKHYDEIEPLVEQAAQAGVRYLLNVGTSYQESLNSIEIAQKYANQWATIGIHPCDIIANPDETSRAGAGRDWKADLAELETLLADREKYKIVGIGETGLDFYHKPYDQALQEQAFRAHIELALHYNLPVVVHIREAGDAALKVLSEYISRGLRGVIHCFSLDLAAAQLATSWGFYIGIDGPVTYPKNHDLRDVVREIGLEYILLETDSPFLPPQVIRGKRNSPARLVDIAEKIAEVKNITREAVATQTTANAKALFKL